jgi:hypothetical protein
MGLYIPTLSLPMGFTFSVKKRSFAGKIWVR